MKTKEAFQKYGIGHHKLFEEGPEKMRSKQSALNRLVTKDYNDNSFSKAVC